MAAACARLTVVRVDEVRRLRGVIEELDRSGRQRESSRRVGTRAIDQQELQQTEIIMPINDMKRHRSESQKTPCGSLHVWKSKRQF